MHLTNKAENVFTQSKHELYTMMVDQFSYSNNNNK